MFADFLNFFIFGFSRKFAIKHLSCFPPHLNCVVTLPCATSKATFPFYHYSCYKNLHQNSFSFLLNVIHIIWHILPQHTSVSTVTACHVRDLLWVLYLPAKQCVSSVSVNSLRVSLSLQTSEIGDIHVYFIRSMAPTPRSKLTELQNLHKISSAGLSQKNS